MLTTRRTYRSEIRSTFVIIASSATCFVSRDVEIAIKHEVAHMVASRASHPTFFTSLAASGRRRKEKEEEEGEDKF